MLWEEYAPPSIKAIAKWKVWSLEAEDQQETKEENLPFINSEFNLLSFSSFIKYLLALKLASDILLRGLMSFSSVWLFLSWEIYAMQVSVYPKSLSRYFHKFSLFYLNKSYILQMMDIIHQLGISGTLLCNYVTRVCGN